MDKLFDNAYSVEELEENKQVLRDFWQGKCKTVWSVYPHENQYRQIENENEMAEKAVANILSGNRMPGINVPRLTIDFGTVTTASYWGGTVKRQSSGTVWIDTIIHNPSEVKKMKHFNPCGGDIVKAFGLYEKVSDILKTKNLPASSFDLQGPLNTLSLIWDQDNMMISMYEQPALVHEALDRITELLINNITCLYKKIPNIQAPLWPYIWLPPDIGIGITEDYMPLISPQLYKEFGLPYIKRLSDKFKGLFIHCCGEFTHQIDNLTNSESNILGMEFVYPKIDIEKLFYSFGDRCVFVPNIMDNHIDDFGSYTKYLKHIEKLRQHGTRLWYILRPDLPDFEEQVRFMESINAV